MVETLVVGCECATLWSDQDLMIDLAVLTLTFINFVGYYTFILCRDIGFRM